jgi:2-polyprenyl-3-methyl-5-hydroxy-6-metoxy-1,4-benzoquinol methylase
MAVKEKGATMTTDYDPIAEQYKRSKMQPWRTYIESYTLMKLVGDLKNKSVVDFACGEGFFSRLLRLQGAAKVLGVDLSERMIELARQQEAAQPLGIEYRVGDGRNLKLPPEHDLAVAAYLLNYARNREELGAMCRSVAGCLKPGGRFVTVNTNPGLDFHSAPSYQKYDFEAKIASDRREGTPITWIFFLEDSSFEIENYYLDVPIHEEAFRSAGFREIRWHQPALSPQGEAIYGREFWADFLNHPPVIFIECVK